MNLAEFSIMLIIHLYFLGLFAALTLPVAAMIVILNRIRNRCAKNTNTY